MRGEGRRDYARDAWRLFSFLSCMRDRHKVNEASSGASERGSETAKVEKSKVF